MSSYVLSDFQEDTVIELDLSGAGGGSTLNWHGEPLSGWSLVEGKDGNAAVAFLQDGSDFRYVVYGDWSDDSTHKVYLNGIELRGEWVELQEGTAAAVNLSAYLDTDEIDATTMTFRVTNVPWDSYGSVQKADGTMLELWVPDASGNWSQQEIILSADELMELQFVTSNSIIGQGEYDMQNAVGYAGSFAFEIIDNGTLVEEEIIDFSFANVDHDGPKYSGSSFSYVALIGATDTARVVVDNLNLTEIQSDGTVHLDSEYKGFSHYDDIHSYTENTFDQDSNSVIDWIYPASITPLIFALSGDDSARFEITAENDLALRAGEALSGGEYLTDVQITATDPQGSSYTKTLSYMVVTQWGSSANDQLLGGDQRDVMVGYGTAEGDTNTADSIDGGAGDDHLYGGGGDDILIGGSGADFLKGGAGSDTLTGGEGSDMIYYGFLSKYTDENGYWYDDSYSGSITFTDFTVGEDRIKFNDSRWSESTGGRVNTIEEFKAALGLHYEAEVSGDKQSIVIEFAYDNQIELQLSQPVSDSLLGAVDAYGDYAFASADAMVEALGGESTIIFRGGSTPSPTLVKQITLSDYEALTLYDDDLNGVVDRAVYTENWVNSSGDHESESDSYQITWSGDDHWQANFVDLLQFTSWDQSDRPLLVTGSDFDSTIQWLERDSVTGKVGEFSWSDDWTEIDGEGNTVPMTMTITVDLLDHQGSDGGVELDGMPDAFTFTAVENQTKNYTGGGELHLDYGADSKPVSAQIVMTRSDFEEEIITGVVTRDTAGGITSFGWPQNSSQEQAIEILLASSNRIIDEDLNNLGRRIAYNGVGSNVESGTEKYKSDGTPVQQVKLSAPEGTDFNGWNLLVSGNETTSSGHQLRLLIGGKSGVFSVDYSTGEITYYHDATYNGQDGSAVTAGVNGVVIGQIDAQHNGKNGQPLKITLNSNTTTDVTEALISGVVLNVRDSNGNVTEDWGAAAGSVAISFELFNGTDAAAVTSAARTVELVSHEEVATDEVSLHIKSWSGMQDLPGVEVLEGKMTGVDGQATLTKEAGSNSLTLSPAWTMTAAEQEVADSAVDLQDAIAILKMIVGLPINGEASTTISPYQAIAADFNADGTVGLNDAIDVLKHVVELPTTGTPKWDFVDAGITVTDVLSPGAVDATLVEDVSTDASIELVGVLRGDVDGSWDVM